MAGALAARPRIAVIKAETWCLPEAIECALSLRHAGVLTIAIGQQVSHVMRAPALRWREAFDLALAGDAEEELLAVLPRLLDDDEFSRHGYWRQFEQGHHFTAVAPERLPRPVFSDAEMTAFAFPFPLPGMPLRRWAYVLSASGCPHRCRHCSTVVRKSSGDRLRTRDIDLAILRLSLVDPAEDMLAETLFEERLCVIAGRDHPLAARAGGRGQYVLELPAGAAKRHGLKAGDTLDFEVAIPPR